MFLEGIPPPYEVELFDYNRRYYVSANGVRLWVVLLNSDGSIRYIDPLFADLGEIPPEVTQLICEHAIGRIVARKLPTPYAPNRGAK
jgi:hypothetical protein